MLQKILKNRIGTTEALPLRHWDLLGECTLRSTNLLDYLDLSTQFELQNR